jgi:parallel beta-helix repeat protein
MKLSDLLERVAGALLIGLVVLVPAMLQVKEPGNRLFREQTVRAESSTLVISQVLYDPFNTEPDMEWVEIYNLSGTSIDLTNYKFGDEETQGGAEGMMAFPVDATIEPDQVRIIANKATVFAATYGFQPHYEMIETDPAVPNMRNSPWATGSIALNNDGDEILLLDPSNNAVDALSWGSSSFAFSPPAPDVPEGASLARRPATADTDTAGDWQARRTPAPGNIVLREILVTNAADSGPGTLRQVLLDAQPGDAITFDPAVFPPGSPAFILLQSALPALSQNQVSIEAGDAGVILDGSQTPAGTTGLTLQGDDCVIQGLSFQYFPGDGVSIAAGAERNLLGGDRAAGEGPHGQGNLVILNGGSGVAIQGDYNRLWGNWIGVDRSGWWDAGNAFNGVALWQGASDNVVGGVAEGYRNVIGGNGQNGLWIGGTGSDRNRVLGNYLGTRADGLGPLPNGLSGIAIQGGAQDNRVGGTSTGAGNLISGNTENGIYLSDPGTRNNRILGNFIGPNHLGTQAIGQERDGIIITLSASENAVGDGTAAGRNLISGNAWDGVRLDGSQTTSNTVQGNYIGTNLSGTLPLPNGLHGVELTGGAHDNLIGGDRAAGEGNLLSGNRNHGLVLTEGAHHNAVAGNLVGPDASGTFSIGQHPMGGIDVSNGAHHNVIGGLGTGEGNVISGNRTDGLALFKSTQDDATDNQVLGNWIGLALNGSSPLPNGGYGILNAEGALRTRIEGNTIAFNETYGVLVAGCGGNTLTRNSIYSNTLSGIKNVGNCPAPPEITGVHIGATEIVTGTTVPDARVEFFSDAEDEGRIYEGFATADGSGQFTFNKVGGFTGPNLTATSTDGDGNTSEFSPATHLAWTLLLYLNGDNDLESYMFGTITQTVAAGPSLRANVLALVDGYTTTITTSGTVLYDLTHGQTTVLDAIDGERNMGDGQTLIDFVTWGRDHYPARQTLLTIVDHGGGWAPANGTPTSGALAYRTGWLAGNSGLSWDFTDGYDYLDSPEIRQALAIITRDGDDPLDVLFYDVCLMGMLEVAYQVQEYADFFVSSQNIGWAPVGPEGRYVQLIHDLAPDTTPRQMAQALVRIYEDSTPPEGHPFTLSAVDMSHLPEVANRVDQLAVAISQTLTGPAQAETLLQAYNATQKIDYDSDFRIEASRDGFVDLYDLALNLSQAYTDPTVDAAAQDVVTALDAALVAEAHRSGQPWTTPGLEWDLDRVHGLSIFMPLGEDLELPIPITETLSFSPTLLLTRNLRLRDTYTPDQLRFVADTSWDGLIDTYYRVISSPVPTATTEGPVDGLQRPDVTPPKTAITVTGALQYDQPLEVSWSTTDAQSSVSGATLWHQPPHAAWQPVLTQTGTSGVFVFTPSQWCRNGLAVRAIDKAGNRERLESGRNTAWITIAPCYQLSLPLLLKGY